MQSAPLDDAQHKPLVEVKLYLPENLARAFRRCLLIRINDSGQTPLQSMEEAVGDFLKKHGC
jgi:hypothetical protein